MRYNKSCPGHPEGELTSYMREDDVICTKCYRRLPQKFVQLAWSAKRGNMGDLSIIVDWLLENPT